MDMNDVLNQTAVYWGSPVASGRGGFTYSSPVELPVRWEKRQELFVNEIQEQEISDAVVYANIDLDIGGYLYLGEEADLDSSHDDPETIKEAYRIRVFSKSVDVSGEEYLRKVLLSSRGI